MLIIGEAVHTRADLNALAVLGILESTSRTGGTWSLPEVLTGEHQCQESPDGKVLTWEASLP